MLLIDAFLRFSGVGLLLLIIALNLRDLQRTTSSLFLLLTCISLVSHFLGFTPEVFNLPYYLRLLFRFLDIFQMVFIWFLALSLFKKDFKLSYFHISVSLIYCAFIFMERLVQFGFINSLPVWWGYTVNALTILIVIHMVATTLKGRTDDLIEKRRRSRVYLVIISAFTAISVVVFGSMLFYQQQPTVDVISVWPAIVGMSFWLLNTHTRALVFDDLTKTSNKVLNARDLDLQKRLNIEVIKNQCFLDNNLSIESLASKLGVSAYRLRGFINQTLGHTNFSTYINTYRIEAIKNDFLKAENDHLPILTIALNNGFSSLSPFNRAFKALEGITPTEFRQKLRNNP